MMRRGHKLTAEERAALTERLREMVGERRMPLAHAARAVGLNVRTARKLCQAAGIATPTSEEALALLHQKRRDTAEWPPEKAEEFRRLVQQEGLTVRAAGMTMGISHGAAGRFAARTGLRSSPFALRASHAASARAVAQRRIAAGLPGVPRPNGPVKRRPKSADANMAPHGIETPPEPAPQLPAWTPGDRDDGCQWIVQTKPLAFCGAARVGRSRSYCAVHHAIAHVRRADPVAADPVAADPVAADSDAGAAAEAEMRTMVA